jgi:hypothetical protein
VTTYDDSATPKPLTDRVMAVVRSSAVGCPLSQIQDAFPEIEPKEVRAVLTTLRNQKLLIGGMSEGEPFYKTPDQCPQTQPGTALRPVGQAQVTKGRGGEATSPARAITGEAAESAAAPRGPSRAARKTTQSTNEREPAMPPKKHDTESHRGAIRGTVLKALGASGDKHSVNALQNLLSPQRRLSGRQMSNALAALKLEGLVKASGRGPGTVWEITAKGVEALGTTGKTATTPKKKAKRSAPRQAKRAVRAARAKAKRPYTRRSASTAAAAATTAPPTNGTTASFTATGEILITSPGRHEEAHRRRVARGGAPGARVRQRGATRQGGLTHGCQEHPRAAPRHDERHRRGGARHRLDGRRSVLPHDRQSHRGAQGGHHPTHIDREEDMDTITTEIPTVAGTPFGGGFYTDRIRIGSEVYAIVSAPRGEGEIRAAMRWNKDLEPVPGARSFFDGLANTNAMAAAGSELAIWARELRIAGLDDWYIPSRDEENLRYRQFKPSADQNFCLSGDNPSAAPPLYAYSPNDPAQTPIEIFKAGNAEAFELDLYWTSTEYAGDEGYAWYQSFYDGYQDDYPKGNELLARAVRRVLITSPL